MKSILKFLPVALGVLTLASCSNEDFFGSGTQKNGKELIPTVENLVNADGGTTRSAWTAGGSYNVSWQEGDQFRVYDEAVQAYDIFSRKAAGITIDGDADVEAHKYALFPGNKVSYAGWDKTNGVSAVMLMEPTLSYDGTEDAKKATFPSGEKMVYTSNLPMWGPVANETSENLEVPLNYLTSVLDVCVYQNATKKIRVVAFKDNTALGTGTVDANGVPATDGAATGALTNLANEAGKETPLSGYFFAQLKDGGQLVKDMTQPGEMKAKYGYTLEIDVANTGDEAHVLIPIIPATYKYLSVQYLVPQGTTTHTNCWVELKGYTNTEIKRGQVRMTGLEIGTAPTPAQVSSLKELSDLLNNAAVTNDMVLNVKIEEGKTLATSEAWNKIELPAKNLTVNIEGAINNSEPHAPLNIVSNATAGTQKITLNVKGGISGTENIIINTDRALTLAGTAACSDENQNTIKKSGTGTLTYGLGEYDSFSTAMVTEVAAGAGKLTIDSPDGTIGKVKNIDAAVEVTSGTVASIESTTGSVTVQKDAEVTSVTTGAAAAVAINASVENVTTASTTVSSTATTPVTIGTLTLKNNAAATLTLTASAEKLLKVTNLVAAKGATGTAAVTVSSTGKVAIINVTENDDATGFTFNASKLGLSAAKDKTTEINSKGEIYTAGQLAGVTTGKSYKLMVAIDADSKDWTGVNINGDFDGNGKTISNLKKAGLFNTISGGTIKNFTISTVENSNDNNPTKGALANEATGTVTIKGVTITGAVVGKATGATNKQIDLGGLIGKTNGTITLEDNQVTASVNGFGNMGGYIGNVAGGTVNILTSKDDASLASVITFSLGGYTYAAADAAKCGTIGNFIGSITGTGVTVIVGSNDTEDATKGAAIGYFFDVTTKGIKDATAADALLYNKHVNGTKVFKGMSKLVEGQQLQYEIGYSTGTISKLTLYNKTKNTFGVPYSLSIDNINYFE